MIVRSASRVLALIAFVFAPLAGGCSAAPVAKDGEDPGAQPSAYLPPGPRQCSPTICTAKSDCTSQCEHLGELITCADYGRCNPTQLREPDLVAGTMPACTTQVTVVVDNQGYVAAGKSTTLVTFQGSDRVLLGTASLPTPAIPAYGSVTLPPLALPATCSAWCTYVVSVDWNDDVVEWNESNNYDDESCRA